jgi:hypothetical protein
MGFKVNGNNNMLVFSIFYDKCQRTKVKGQKLLTFLYFIINSIWLLFSSRSFALVTSLSNRAAPIELLSNQLRLLLVVFSLSLHDGCLFLLLRFNRSDSFASVVSF